MAVASLTALAALCAQPAGAQQIDYGSLEQLFGEPVTTSATGSPQRATDAPANILIIPAEHIRRSGAYDIPGVLRHFLGIDVMRWNNDDADVGLRGYDQSYSPRVLVLIDGRQVYAEHYGHTPWAALPVELSAIRQIEVTKGPNAALYGFNAVNGVVNIITYSPLFDDVNTASVRGGTQGAAEVSLVKTFKFGDVGGVRLSANGRVDDDFSTPIPPSAGKILRRHNDHYAFDIDGVFAVAQGVQFGFEATHSGATANEIDPIYALSLAKHEMSSAKGQLTAETDFGLVQATVYHNWSSRSSRNLLNAFIDFNNEATVAQIQDLFRIGSDHTLRAALEYRHNMVNTTPFQGGRISYADYAASLMWAWNILPGLSLSNALRWEDLELGRSGPTPPGYPFTNADWDRTITEFSYNSGLVWKATEDDTIRLLAGRGDQLPSLNNFGAFLIATPTANSTGNPAIDATDVSNYEINWDRSLKFIDARFRAAAFYQESEDIIAIGGKRVAGPIPPPYRVHTNIGSSVARGVELSLNGTVGETWRWGANYRFEVVKDSFIPSAAGGIAYSDFEHVTPRHMVKAELGWTGGKWEVDGFLYYQSATRGLAGLPFSAGSFLVPVNAYLSADARIAYRPNDWATLAVSGQNLLESPQQQTSGPAVERRVLATLTISY